MVALILLSYCTPFSWYLSGIIIDGPYTPIFFSRLNYFELACCVVWFVRFFSYSFFSVWLGLGVTWFSVLLN